ncbi:MAG: magnesium transporter MgtE N-terminal domain-containing protein [Candidatus Eisenbacteria bacterium]
MIRRRWIVIAAVVFVVALTAGTGARLMTAPKGQPGAAGAGADADAGAVAETDLAAAGAPVTEVKPSVDAELGGAETAAVAAEEEAEKMAEETAAATSAETASEPQAQRAASAESAAAAQPVSSGPAEPAAAPGTRYKQFAKILNNMKPADAAKLLAGFTDEQVEEILHAVGARKAADLLARLPEDRAARIGRRLLPGATEEER